MKYAALRTLVKTSCQIFIWLHTACKSISTLECACKIHDKYHANPPTTVRLSTYLEIELKDTERTTFNVGVPESTKTMTFKPTGIFFQTPVFSARDSVHTVDWTNAAERQSEKSIAPYRFVHFFRYTMSSLHSAHPTQSRMGLWRNESLPNYHGMNAFYSGPTRKNGQHSFRSYPRSSWKPGSPIQHWVGIHDESPLIVWLTFQRDSKRSQINPTHFFSFKRPADIEDRFLPVYIEENNPLSIRARMDLIGIRPTQEFNKNRS